MPPDGQDLVNLGGPPGLPESKEILDLILDAMPAHIFLVDEDVQIFGVNRAASRLLARETEVIIRRRAGEVLHCLHALAGPEGCGSTVFCLDCPVRNSVTKAVHGQKVVQHPARMELVQDDKIKEIHLLITASPLEYRNKMFALLILEDISEIMELKGLLPICASCKKIRNDQQYWQSVESYFKEQLDLNFTHGLCPDCADKLYKEIQ